MDTEVPSLYREYDRLLAVIQTPEGATWDNLHLLRREASRVLGEEWIKRAEPSASMTIEEKCAGLGDCYRAYDDVAVFLKHLHETRAFAGEGAAASQNRALLEDLLIRFAAIKNSGPSKLRESLRCPECAARITIAWNERGGVMADDVFPSMYPWKCTACEWKAKMPANPYAEEGFWTLDRLRSLGISPDPVPEGGR